MSSTSSAGSSAAEEVLDRVSGERVVVTGGYGAIGGMVVRRLLELGALPIVVDVLDDNLYLRDLEDDFVSVHVDVGDLEGLTTAFERERVTQVIHLAKVIGPYTQDDPTLSLRVNVMGSGHVLEAARRVGVNRVVFSSSKTVYAELTGVHAYPELAPIAEDYPKFDRGDPRNVLFYSTTNKMVEYYGIRFARRFDMEFVITRFASTYGPGKPGRRKAAPGGGFAGTGQPGARQNPYRTFGNFASFIVESAFDGAAVEVPQGREQRADLVYNGDLANGLIAACCSDRIQFEGSWREFHFGIGRPVSVGEVADATQQRFPEAVIDVGPGLMSGYDHSEMLAVFDLSRGARELGYTPAYAPPAAVAHYAELLEIGRKNQR